MKVSKVLSLDYDIVIFLQSKNNASKYVQELIEKDISEKLLESGKA